MGPILGISSTGQPYKTDTQGRKVDAKTGVPLPLVDPKNITPAGDSLEHAATAPAKDGTAVPTTDGTAAPTTDVKTAPAKDGTAAPAKDGTAAPTTDVKTAPATTPAPVDFKSDEQQKGDVVYHVTKRGDSLSSIVANNFEIVDDKGNTKPMLMGKNGVVTDPKEREIALKGAEAIAAAPQNKPIAEANTEFAKKDKKHHRYGSDKANFLGLQGAPGQDKTSQVVLGETYDIKLADGSAVKIRRINAPTPEPPAPQGKPVEAEPTKLTVDDAKMAREDIPSCGQRQFNGGNVNACYDGPSAKDTNVGVYRPVVGGNVDRNHSLTAQQAVDREKSAHSEGRAVALKPEEKVPEVLKREYVDTKTGKPVDTATDAGRATLLQLEDGIRHHEKNKGASFTSGSKLFMPRTASAYGQNFMLSSDFAAMNIPQNQNEQKWTLASWFKSFFN